MDRMLGIGLRGFKLHPEYQGFAPDEERMVALMDATAEREMTVLFHAGLDIGLPSLRGTPAAFARMLQLVPGLTAILAHMGGFQLWDEVEEHLAGASVYLDTSYTSGHLSDERFLALVRSHGAERVLFGTDGPWPDMKHEVDRMGALGLDDDELAAIMGGNADELLGGE
jgi:predicted TIM-barrel fold metal-dependent hydrolase